MEILGESERFLADTGSNTLCSGHCADRDGKYTAFREGHTVNSRVWLTSIARRLESGQTGEVSGAG